MSRDEQSQKTSGGIFIRQGKMSPRPCNYFRQLEVSKKVLLFLANNGGEGGTFRRQFREITQMGLANERHETECRSRGMNREGGCAPIFSRVSRSFRDGIKDKGLRSHGGFCREMNHV